MRLPPMRQRARGQRAFQFAARCPASERHYGGHKRLSRSGEYQGTSGTTLRVMQPLKNVAQ